MTPSNSTDPQPDINQNIGFLNGDWLDVADMSISIGDAGFRQAVTAVERLRTYDGKIFQVKRHLQRWSNTAAALRIANLPQATKIESLFQQVLARNSALVDHHEGDIGITMFATPGVPGAQTPTFAVHLNEIDRVRNKSRREFGQPVIITDVVQPPSEAWPRSAKVRCRLHYYLADQQAQQSDVTASGVLIDSDGSITETSISNIAIVSEDQITSPKHNCVLPGVTQAVVQDLAKEADVNWKHAPIMPDDLMNADEVLLMGTDTGLWFASRVNEKTFDENPGPICALLQKAFRSRL